MDLVEEMSDQQLREELLKPQWGLKKKEVPKKRAERMDMLETLYANELQRRKEVAFSIALNHMLAAVGLGSSGPKAQLFKRLTMHLKAKASGSVDACRGGGGAGATRRSQNKVNEVLLMHQNGTSTSSGSALKAPRYKGQIP